MGLSMGNLFSKAVGAAYQNTEAMLADKQLNTPAKYLYAIINGKQEGPYSPGEVMVLIQSGSITPETYMWKPGMPEWKLAKEITDIASGVNLTPPACPQNNDL